MYINSATLYFPFVKCWGKKWEYNAAVYQLFIDFKKAYDSVRREVFYNILMEFGITQETDKANKNVSDRNM